MKVGVLSLQGGVIEHKKAIEALGHTPVEVKKESDLDYLDAIILPGGESTTISKLLKVTGLINPLKNKIENGLKTWGTCAGLILLAKEIEGEEGHLKLMDIKVKRNGFGSQIDSFKEEKIIEKISKDKIELVFIRAPYISEIGDDVEVLCKVKDKIVAVKQENILGTAFHPELTNDTRVLEYFLNRM